MNDSDPFLCFLRHLVDMLLYIDHSLALVSFFIPVSYRIVLYRNFVRFCALPFGVINDDG